MQTSRKMLQSLHWSWFFCHLHFITQWYAICQTWKKQRHDSMMLLLWPPSLTCNALWTNTTTATLKNPL